MASPPTAEPRGLSGSFATDEVSNRQGQESLTPHVKAPVQGAANSSVGPSPRGWRPERCARRPPSELSAWPVVPASRQLVTATWRCLVDLEELPEVLTVEEAAAVLRIGRTAAYELCRQWRATGGRSGLPVLAFGRSLRVPKAALARILEPPRGDA